MAENTGIEWADHTFNRSASLHRGKKVKCIGMHEPMAGYAKRYTITCVGSPFGKFSERQDMVNLQVPTSIITAVSTGKPVARHAVIAPAFVFVGEALAASLCPLAIYVARRIRTGKSRFSGALADQRAGFRRMLLSKSITWTRLCRRTHFSPAFSTHFLTLHRRNEGLFALFPSLLNNFAAREFCHG